MPRTCHPAARREAEALYADLPSLKEGLTLPDPPSGYTSQPDTKGAGKFRENRGQKQEGETPSVEKSRNQAMPPHPV